MMFGMDEFFWVCIDTGVAFVCEKGGLDRPGPAWSTGRTYLYREYRLPIETRFMIQVVYTDGHLEDVYPTDWYWKYLST